MRSLLFQCLLLSCYRALQSDEGEERRLEQRFILEPTVSSYLTNFLLKPTHLNSTHHFQQHLSFVDCAMKLIIKTLNFGRDVKLGVPCLDAACIVGLNLL